MCWYFPSQKQFTSPIAEGVGTKKTSDLLSSITSKSVQLFYMPKGQFHKSKIITLRKRMEKLQLSHMPRHHLAKKHS